MPPAARKRRRPHAAAPARLVHVDDSMPGIRRQRRGKGFSYTDPEGRPIRDAGERARLAALAIPPAWTDVWICRDPDGHLQATGRDARGRKQYRYHPEWTRRRGETKYARLAAFGRHLPALRRRLRRDLAREGLPREKVLAAVISLLEDTLVRVGNEEYARSNHSYGLTTLRARHLVFRRGRAHLRFRGKSGQPHAVDVDDARLARVLRRCRQLPGQALFQYYDADGQRQAVDSGQVNDYLHEVLGEAFTAKDFRTWGGTLAALAILLRTPLPDDGSERAIASALAAVVREVAAELRNTPAVCRKAYIHPLVIEAWREGRLHALAGPRVARQRRKLEALALELLGDDPRCR